MKTVVRGCLHPGCRRRTSSPTGRCHDHGEISGVARRTIDIPPPSGSAGKRSCPTDDGGRLEEWESRPGTLSYELGPASIRYRPDGRVWIEEWWLDGMRERAEGGPTTVEYFPDGETVKTEYYSDGHETHREGAPAKISYSRTGEVIREEWFANGHVHRDGGPSITTYRGGRKYAEEWTSNSTHHRLDGPAYVRYAEDGETVELEEWRVLGDEVDGFVGVTRKLDDPRSRIVLPSLYRSVTGRRAEDLTEAEVRAAIVMPSYVRLLGHAIPEETIRKALVAGVRTPEGIRQVQEGAPAEWVRAFEESAP